VIVGRDGKAIISGGAPTFGLVAVDRSTFERRPKPSIRWLGEVAQAGRLP